MKIEIQIDENCTESKIIIVTDNIFPKLPNIFD